VLRRWSHASPSSALPSNSNQSLQSHEVHFFVEHRVGDKRIIRLIQKWLKAGRRTG